MKNIVVSMQNKLLAESVIRALRETGDFRPQAVLPDRLADMIPLCKALNADVLVMEVGRQPGYSLKERLAAAQGLRLALPACKTALICDENTDPDIAQSVKTAKQDGLTDAFFYTSVTAAYLTAMLDTL